MLFYRYAARVHPVRGSPAALPARRNEAHVGCVPAQPSRFRAFSCWVAAAVGSHWAFALALFVIIAWAVTGPLFHFSDTWQLVINTGTTIVTFLMVFLIQATQNRDSQAVHLKLDELIRAQHRARNIFADLENASEEELKEFAEEFKVLRERGLSDAKATRKAAAHAAQD
jgi:low affinity Fe/Cu permease